MDLASTVAGGSSTIIPCSVAPLVQAVIPVCHAVPGIFHADVTPHFARDLRTLGD